LVYHNDGGFYREDRIALEDLAGAGIDRKVQIVYKGTESWGALTNGNGAKKQQTFIVSVDVGYFVNDHQFISESIIADDEGLIGRRIIQQQYWPTCVAGCVQGYTPVSSQTVDIGGNRLINQITVRVMIYG